MHDVYVTTQFEQRSTIRMLFPRVAQDLQPSTSQTMRTSTIGRSLDFRYIKDINLLTRLKTINIVANWKINSGQAPLEQAQC